MARISLSIKLWLPVNDDRWCKIESPIELQIKPTKANRPPLSRVIVSRHYHFCEQSGCPLLSTLSDCQHRIFRSAVKVSFTGQRQTQGSRELSQRTLKPFLFSFLRQCCCVSDHFEVRRKQCNRQLKVASRGTTVTSARGCSSVCWITCYLVQWLIGPPSTNLSSITARTVARISLCPNYMLLGWSDANKAIEASDIRFDNGNVVAIFCPNASR